jgi:hypothetical protein
VYSQNDKVKDDDMRRAFSMNGEKRNACRLSMEKPEERNY